MARVSKKVSAAQREAENAQHRIWKTAIYARLSDFDDVLRNTESLEVQISYIKEYINHRDDLMLLDVFADKRCTGMNFDRPEFERLLKALQERKIDCIVVKDFSRLGRNFVETGQYLEQVFPLFGVRFIAINDNYDSLNSQSRDGMLVPIKSMINEMYSKDLSQKIQSCFRSKEARGEIYTLVPFGYKKNKKNHLILDEEVSDVVVRIFLWKKSGMKEREIAKKLSAQGIPTPFTRRCQLGYMKNITQVKDSAWQPAFVTKVLENPVYTGTMVYNRIAYDETYRKIGENPRESWRMVPDSHPAIISWELFDEVSALREAEQAVKVERKKWCRQRRKNNPNIFKGRIFCKECGEKLGCQWQENGSLYFYCSSCHVSISEKDLWNGINKKLHQRLEEHKNLKKLIRKNSGKSVLETKKVALNRKIEQLSGSIVRLESQKRSGYEQYVLGKISKEKFLELKQDLENEIVELKREKATKEKERTVVQEELWQKKQIADNTGVLLTADNLQQYVKKIEVDREKITCTEFVFLRKGEQTMKEKIYDAQIGMEYALVGDYYLPALKLPLTRPIGRWGMLYKAYLKLRKPAYYQSLLLSGKLDAVLADVEEQAAERYEILIEQMSQREGISEKLKEENQMEWVRRMSNLENRAAEIVKIELIYPFEGR